MEATATTQRIWIFLVRFSCRQLPCLLALFHVLPHSFELPDSTPWAEVVSAQGRRQRIEIRILWVVTVFLRERSAKASRLTAGFGSTRPFRSGLGLLRIEHAPRTEYVFSKKSLCFFSC